jgi:hypothetical protein
MSRPNLRQQFHSLLAGDEKQLALGMVGGGQILKYALAIVLSCAIYGATFGLWRSGQQSLFTALKFPLVVFLTCGGNALLNGCLAMVLGTGIGFRQSSVAILMSFTIMGIILVGFAPVMLFLLWNLPTPNEAQGLTGRNIHLLANVIVIAYAGVVGNRRLLQLLRGLTGSPAKARLVLLAWLAGNLLLGTQISWILRPWVGTPGDTVHFFTSDPMRGNFFEAIWQAAKPLVFSTSN